MVAAAGAGVAAVDHVFVGAEAGKARLFIKRRRVRHRLAPGVGGVDVDLDDAGIGRHLDDVEPRVGRRRVALDAHRGVARLGDGLHRGEDFQIILQPLGRRHEHAQETVAHLHRQRRADGGLGEELFAARELAAVEFAEMRGRRQRARVG